MHTDGHRDGPRRDWPQTHPGDVRPPALAARRARRARRRRDQLDPAPPTKELIYKTTFIMQRHDFPYRAIKRIGWTFDWTVLKERISLYFESTLKRFLVICKDSKMGTSGLTSGLFKNFGLSFKESLKNVIQLVHWLVSFEYN